MDTSTKPTTKQVAAALRTVAGLLGIQEGHGLHDYGEDDSVSGTCSRRQAERIAAGMTAVSTEEWTGMFGDQYRTYNGTLFGRTVRATHLIEQS
jgi:hypothetical protein